MFWLVVFLKILDIVTLAFCDLFALQFVLGKQMIINLYIFTLTLCIYTHMYIYTQMILYQYGHKILRVNSDNKLWTLPAKSQAFVKMYDLDLV